MIDNDRYKRNYQRQVGVRRTELDVDEFVDVYFGLLVEVLIHHGLHFCKTGKHN